MRQYSSVIEKMQGDNMLWDITRVTIIFLSHCLTLPLMMEAKESVRHPRTMFFIVFLLLEIISFAVLNIAGELETASGFALMVISATVYCIAFSVIAEGPVAKNIFLFIAYCICYLFTSSFSLLFAYALPVSQSGREAVMIAGLIISTATCIVLLKLRPGRQLKKIVNDITKGWGILALFAVLSFIAVGSVVMFSLFYMEKNAVLSFILPPIMFLFVASAFAVVINLIRLLSERNSVVLLRSQQAFLENELEAEKEFVDNARKARHDMRHHSRLLLEYIQNGDIEGAKAYLREYDDEITGLSDPEWTCNKVVNAFLRITARRCASLSIPFSIKCDIPENLPLSNLDLGIVIGNIFEKAVMNCTALSDTLLSVVSKVVDDVMFFEVRNCSEIMGGSSQNPPPSSLRSVSDMLSRHDGMLEYYEKDGLFSIRFILPL